MSAAPSSHVVQGVLVIIAGALSIAIQDVIIKLFSAQMTLWQIFALRGLLTMPIFFAICVVRRADIRNLTRQAFGVWPLLRAALITMTLLAFYAAVPFLNLSTVGAANYIAPIFVALLSAYVLREKVGLQRWIGVLLGFVGVLLLLRPGSDAFSPWVLLPVFGAACYACAHLITRSKCSDIPVGAMTLSMNVSMMTAGMMVSAALWLFVPIGALTEQNPYLFDTWFEMTWFDAGILLLLAMMALLNGVLIARAYQIAPPPIVATFEYSYLIFAVLLEFILFAVIPSSVTVAGMAMIIVAGLLVLFHGPVRMKLTSRTVG